MARSATLKLARAASRGFQIARTTPRISAPAFLRPASAQLQSPTFHALRFISQSSTPRGITPDNQPSKQAVTPPVTRTPAPLTTPEYHTLADAYLDRLLTALEELQDQREDVDVEYQSGVLTLNLGPEVGTYVINKQPPSKQIWLSSPKSGPKRYDYVVLGESQNEKQDTATGDWVHLRDGSTLDQLLLDEIGVDLSAYGSQLGN